MKKIILISAVVIALTSVYSHLTVQAKPQATTDYIVIRYNPYWLGQSKQYVIVCHADSEEQIQLTKEQANKTTSFVRSLMAKYNAEGYELVSSTNDGGERINCFFEEVELKGK